MDEPTTSPLSRKVYVIVTKTWVKSIKTDLESRRKLDRSEKIFQPSSHGRLNSFAFATSQERREDIFLIPTTKSVEVTDSLDVREWLVSNRKSLASSLGIADDADTGFALGPCNGSTSDSRATKTGSRGGVLAQTVRQWLQDLPTDLTNSLGLSIPNLLSQSSWTYTTYGPLILLPPTTFQSPAWIQPALQPILPTLYTRICKALHVTHIALNAPIPPSTTNPANPTDPTTTNILRSPTSLHPLHGHFGNPEAPSAHAFARAFWTSTRQHGIQQTWAPLHTMFSRGNISEKGRLLSLAELTPPVLGAPPADCTAVDLYAGIGYFAFCYTRAGVGRVLCWELNAWSVEGLRRGAAANGWAVGVWSADVAVDAGAMAWDDAVDDVGVMERRIVVFPENNERAAGRVAAMRRQLPPVRHVNCGFLPSSRDSWGTAVRVLDPGLGGWVHAHENIASGEIEERRKEIVGIFDVLANGGSIAPVYQVHCQHLERVKSYAPGVIHCVLDICIAPLRGIGSEL